MESARQERVEAHLAALRASHAGQEAEPSRGFNVHPVRCTQPEGQRQEAIDGRPLAEQLRLRINFAGGDPDSFARFTDALADVIEGLPELDRNLLSIRWRDTRPTATLVDQQHRGARSHYDPQTGGFRFAWDVLANLLPRLLRAALAHELAHAILTSRGERPTEGTAMHLAMSYGHPPFPR
jgi:hypothetical protein